ncbi:leucine-rich repeat domain-containing protein [uncultured Capnocytophaga sp.]|uniref:leucine-rich repeat domain-containing protein n=1 Tax=uncultured Capnocytophaga sp. TaxID=159273 RepID=UPI00261C663B|nr:leucine-rich repeat domain-containing protein [uncultured Capnocytophaga sp.]
MKKIVIAMAMMGLLTISSCGKEDNNSSDKGGKEQTIPSNYYVVSPDGTTLMKWFNTEVTSIDMQSDKVLSKITKITAQFGPSEKLTSVVLPNSLETIGFRAFGDCTSLSSITFPNSLKTIGDCAFIGSALSSITFPNSLTSIGGEAFAVCTSLSSITFPNSLTTIGDHAFSKCSTLTSVTIPKNVTNIIGAFYNTNLKTIIFEGEIPPTTSYGSFIDSGSSLETIYVPAGSIDRYKNTEGFKEYADKIKAKP